jgi:pimeloyl-ACP methyl ester carboxylesterase
MRYLHRTRSASALLAAALFAPLTAPLVASLPAAAAEAKAPAAQAPLAAQGATPPKITWTSCGSDLPGLDCARLLVPLDYDSPGGDQVSLALVKRPADNPAARIGSLLLNPGGPGGSGVAFVAQAGDVLFTPAVRAAFDLIGFDPRGIAGSTQLQCFATTEDQLDVLPSMAFPVTRAEEAQWVAGLRAVSKACDRRGGPILDHMSTANVARDMDRIRLGLGESTLNFVGYSYGSMVGSTYANLFPDRVRAVVIDGILDPVSWTTGRGDQADTLSVTGRLVSEQGAYETLQQFFPLCDAGGDTCAFSEGNPRQRFDRLASQLLEEPAEVPDGNGGTVTVTYADLVSVTLGALYSSAIWRDLAALLADLDGLVDPEGAGAALTSLRARLAPRAAAFQQTYEQVYEGFAGPACADSDNPDDESAWARSARRADEKWPYFGRPWHWISSGCASWPGVDKDRYTGPWNTRSAAPVLVVGNRYDPATRYQGAVSTARLLGRARLLTVEAWGHTSLFTSTCADNATAAYLLTGTLPAPGTTCRADAVPFASAAAAGGRSSAAAMVQGLVRPRPAVLPAR